MTIGNTISEFHILKEKYSFIESLLQIRSNNTISIRIKLPLLVNNTRHIVWDGDFEDFKRDINIINYIQHRFQNIVQYIVPASPKYFYIKYVTRVKMIKVKILNEYFKPNLLDRIIEFIFF